MHISVSVGVGVGVGVGVRHKDVHPLKHTHPPQGLNTKMIQIAARCFGIDPKHVTVTENSTDKVANSSPTAASMSTDL